MRRADQKGSLEEEWAGLALVDVRAHGQSFGRDLERTSSCTLLSGSERAPWCTYGGAC